MTPPARIEVEANLRERMPERLYSHSREVALYAEGLARRHGADAEWMYIAGLYHDLGKTLELSEMRRTADRQSVVYDPEEAASPSLLHSSASAALFAGEMAPPEAFIRAVRGHTTGNAPFGLEEQILYVADFAEPSRVYEECVSVRTIAERDMTAAALAAVSFKIRFLMLRGRSIHPKSILLYNFLLQHPPK